MKGLNLHLISDTTIATLKNIASYSLAPFSNLKTKTYVWPSIKNLESLETCLKKIEEKPGIVLYIISNYDIREKLKAFCLKKKIPCIGVIGKIINEMSAYLGVSALESTSDIKMDNDYFEKIEAIDYTLKHDDGQKLTSLEEADVVILGPSRTSKSPTCIYLAFNGLKAANVPIVPNLTLPNEINFLKKPLIVGFLIDPDRLVEVRTNRLKSNSINLNIDYVNYLSIKKECVDAKKYYQLYNWPIIDVTLKSVEEISSDILKLYFERKQNFIKRSN